MANFDELLFAIGGFGRYQMVTFLIHVLSVMSHCSQNGFMILGLVQPRCFDVNHTSVPLLKAEASNFTVCNLTSDRNSLANYFLLYGSRASIAKDVTSIFLIGALFGPIVFGMIADRFGRKRVFLASELLMVIFRCSTYFAPNIVVYSILLFFTGFFGGGAMKSGFTWFVEVIPRKYLVLTCIGGIAYFTLGALGYLIRDWKNLSLAICVYDLLILPIGLMLFESPKWLKERHRVSEARDIIVKITKFNGKYNQKTQVVIEEMLPLANAEDSEKVKLQRSTLHYWHLFYDKTHAVYTCAISLNAFVTGLVYYGLMFNIEKLVGDAALNLMIIQGLRQLVTIGFMVIDVRFDWVKRKRVYMITTVIYATCMTLKIVGYSIVGSQSTADMMIQVSSFIALGVSSAHWFVNDTLVVEIFPSSVKTMAFSFNSTAIRIGSILAPQVLKLFAVYKAAPFIFFLGLLMLSFAIVYPSVPETRGRELKELPDHVYSMRLRHVLTRSKLEDI